ncbi:NAD+ synthase [Neolewinella agarilytica]|uniref:Glutamine-dependent NAD(+) synthetase n=1 Tax=Neolewinella agarilytica TaxID=478744 RepID=A0A1H9N4I9_9BACT|nr:NAD+ synthase [Neolewinella agarilytica]SER30333.1 NH(3)-dependent NAD(+) synthetase [Neolewinella agarilytica]
MNIALAQINVHVGNFDANLAKMLEFTAKAKEQKADIVVFPELATVGYPPRDFLEFDDFIDRAEAVVQQLAKAAVGIAIVVGSVSRNPVVEGKDLYNSAYFLANGRVQKVQHKTLLPTYDIFDEYRYFEPAHEWGVVRYMDKTIALVVCEDSWNVGNENPLYKINPMDQMMEHNPDMIINVSASPFAYNHAANRIEVMQANCLRYNLPMYYVNHVGAQTEVLFDGGSIVLSADGTLVDEMPYFEEGMRIYNTEEVDNKENVSGEQTKEKIALIHDGIVMGIKNYFGKLGFKKAILGLSGGIDSALVAVLAARALGPDNVRCILMPSQYSSAHSVNDARELSQNLGCQYDIVPIEDIYNTYMDVLKPHFWAKDEGLAEENLQARARGMLLMAFSNKFGNILLNTSNKSEMAVGYGTLYGDMCGGLSVIGDVYKTECFELARYINKDGEVIPENIITKPPSAELKPDQFDSDSLPPYDQLDAVLYQYIELTKSPQDIIEMGFDEALVKRTLRLVNINEFKRYQTAPVLRVSKKSFGMGRRMPIVAKYLN